MQIREFLTAVTPGRGIVLARRVQRTAKDTKRTYWTMVHEYHDDIASVVARLRSAGALRDLYFALAGFEQGFHDNPETGKKQVRVRTNVQALKALWLDIDVGKADGYQTATEALRALQGFVKRTGIPGPSIAVHSGNGLHLYWPLAAEVGLEQWQRLANALRAACDATGLLADGVCTIDACRVLRVPGTMNAKDPGNPRPVKLLKATGATVDPASMLQKLLTIAPDAPAGLPAKDDEYSEFTGKTNFPKTTAKFEDITKHCGVSKNAVESRGAVASEPEWTALLQLLKHCEDGDLWVHAVSDGHPGYSKPETEIKWAHRKKNEAGPTLCTTLAPYHPALCKACPHWGHIKTPLQLGEMGEAEPIAGLPPGWRIMKNYVGIERKVTDDEGNVVWEYASRYIPLNISVSRSMTTNEYEVNCEWKHRQSESIVTVIPAGHFGNTRKLAEGLAHFGVVLRAPELKNMVELMSTWIARLQAARRVAAVTERLGWGFDGEQLVSFSVGETTYYTDGRVRNDVRPAKEFAAIARYYSPMGSYDEWKKVSTFLCRQGNPAFLAAFAAAFAPPLMRFTGLSGGLLSFVSAESGVGKTSALRLSQSVWGSPVHGMNAVDDTPKSVARKLGFLHNLPAYWDEVRGHKTLEDFVTLAFQITQGKERTRLDSSAHLREIQTWDTLMIVASNSSIMNAMGQMTEGTDAGLMRTFEITVAPFQTSYDRAKVTLLFEKLSQNYGHAGALYAQYLAENHKAVEAKVQKVFTGLDKKAKMAAQERFWFAIVSTLIVGASIANEIGVASIDVKVLTKFLMEQLARLRGSAIEVAKLGGGEELLARFIAANQGSLLIVDDFPKKGGPGRLDYLPEIVSTPRTDAVVLHAARDSKRLRFSVASLHAWAAFNYKSNPRKVVDDIKAMVGVRQIKTSLGIGTKWELPRQEVIEVATSTVEAVDTDDLVSQASTPVAPPSLPDQ